MGDEREPVNCEVPFIRLVVVFCGNGGQRGIKTSSYFEKCVYAKLKSRENKNIQVFEKLCQQTFPNIPKHLEAQGREGYGDPGPTSRDTLVTIPNLPMVAPAIDLNQLRTGIFHLLSFQ